MRRAEQSERKSLTRSASLRPPVHSVLPSFVRLMCACVDRAAEILSSFCPFRGDWRGSKLEMERIRARAQPGRGIWNWGAERMKKDRVEPTNERMIEREGRRHVTRAPQSASAHSPFTNPTETTRNVIGRRLFRRLRILAYLLFCTCFQTGQFSGYRK